MSLDSPWMLLCLVVVPLLVVAYVGLLRRRSRRAERLASEGLVASAASRRGLRWRRHVPFALFAAAIVLVCVGLARPTMSFALPQREVGLRSGMRRAGVPLHRVDTGSDLVEVLLAVIAETQRRRQ